jgi:glucuronate isomerase
MPSTPWMLSSDRCFAANPARHAVARELYARVEDLPLVSPHGHVPPALLADPDARLGTPAELFIIPDHYVFRMLYSQGIPLEDLGVPTRDGTPVETARARSPGCPARSLAPAPRPPYDDRWPSSLRFR